MKGQVRGSSTPRPGSGLPHALRRALAGELSKTFLLKAGSLCLLIAVWIGVSRTVSTELLPGPLATFKAMLGILGSVEGLYNFGMTLFRVTGGVAIAMSLGIITGIPMGLFPRVEKMADMWIMVGLTIPGLVYSIIGLMWFGLTEFAALFAISITTFPSITVNIWNGVKDIDKKLVEMGRVFGAPSFKRITRIVLPQLAPYFFAALRFGLGITWKVTVVVEMLGLSSGVGFMLNYWFNMFDMPMVLAWTFLFVIVMIVLELGIIKQIENRLLIWRPKVAL